MVWNCKCFFLLILVAGGAGLVGKRHVNGATSCNKSYQIPVSKATNGVVMRSNRCHLSSHHILPQQSTAKVVHLPFDPSFLTVSGEDTDAEYLKKTTQDDISPFFVSGGKTYPCFSTQTYLLYSWEFGPLGEDFSYFRIGLQWDLPTEFPPPSSVTWFNVSHVKSLEEYVLASSEKLTSPQVQGYDFNQGLG